MFDFFPTWYWSNKTLIKHNQSPYYVRLILILTFLCTKKMTYSCIVELNPNNCRTKHCRTSHLLYFGVFGHWLIDWLMPITLLGYFDSDGTHVGYQISTKSPLALDALSSQHWLKIDYGISQTKSSLYCQPYYNLDI